MSEKIDIDYFIRTGIGANNTNTKAGMKNTLSEVQDIRRQIEDLQKRSAVLVMEGRDEAMNAIKAMMRDYTISAADLGLVLKAPPRAPRVRNASAETKLPMKYLDPESGMAWAGRGRPPAWIDGKQYQDYLINKETPVVAAS